MRTVSVRECSVDEKGTVFSKWSEITLVFQSYLLEDRCFISQIPSGVRLLEGPLTSAHQVFGEFWKTRDITLPKSNNKFAPENRPFDTKLEISSNPTIHFQGRLLRATAIIPLMIAALLGPYSLTCIGRVPLNLPCFHDKKRPRFGAHLLGFLPNETPFLWKKYPVGEGFWGVERACWNNTYDRSKWSGHSYLPGRR